MLRLLMSTTAVALLSSAAVAADLPVYEPAPMVAPTPVAYNWTGFYIGVHGGYGWADNFDGRIFNGPGGADDDIFDSEVNGPVLGGQIGANWQWNWFVFGAEGDASWAGMDFDDEDGLLEDDDDAIDFLASARLRAGVAFDRVLIYGTGGAGFAGFNSFGDGVGDDDDDDEIELGWTAGGGVEVAVTDNVTIGAEYLHYGFDDVFDDNDGNGDFDGDMSGDIDVIRGRVNVKFNMFGG